MKKTIRNFLTILEFVLKAIYRKRIFVAIVIGGVLLLGTAYCLLATMQTHPSGVSINEQLLHKRLFISVCEDSLQQLVNSRGLSYDSPGFFSRRAVIGLPDDDQLVQEADTRNHIENVTQHLRLELDSLQNHYPDELEIKRGQLLCPTEKIGGTRYVNIPVVLLIRIKLMPIIPTDSL